LSKILSPLELVYSSNKTRIFIKKDYLIHLGTGTKFRKALGIKSYLESKKIQSIELTGSLHGNFLSSFAYLFSNWGYEVFISSHTKNPNLVTNNSKIAKKYSIPSQNCNDSFVFKIPEYGFMRESLFYLDDIWKEISAELSSSEFKIILEVGSGLTLLSALTNNHYVKAVSIGENSQNFKKSFRDKLSILGLDKGDWGSWEVWDPLFQKRFGSVNAKTYHHLEELERKYNIPLEPIYSGKSWILIDKWINENQLLGDFVYLHQGGLWNHHPELCPL
jgi:1-aminocyclopropane-1-carboxylate deaminase